MDESKQRLILAYGELDEQKVVAETTALLSQGYGKKDVFALLRQGMKEVEQRYAAGEYYIADLIMSGTIFRSAMALPGMHTDGQSPYIGRIVMGTVSEDIHDLGKNTIAGLLAASGFEVIDLGISVSPERFVGAVAKYKPDILSMSGVISSAGVFMKNTVELLDATGLREGLKILAGGSLIHEPICRNIGVDYFSHDPLDGLSVCLGWVHC
ncbi:MAG: cobalamin-dependent protein [Oscillospiraceae bacterium]|nr:cobalamin-dependent protein [Oscillospiraceae bacterium]